MKKKQMIALAMGALASLPSHAGKEGRENSEGTKKELENKLLQLERMPANERRLQVGAMCYMTAGPHDTEYVCPKCGQRTSYSNPKRKTGMTDTEKQAYDKQWGLLVKINALMSYRRNIAELSKRIQEPGFAIELDESSFCNHCSKNEEKDFYLVVKYPDKTDHKAKLNDPSDLTILEAFFDGEDVWKGKRGEEYLLKPQAARIRELLGIPGKKASQTTE